MVFYFGVSIDSFVNLSYGEEVSPASTSSTAKAQRWGIGIHCGYFGVPDFILDELFVEHPSVSGSTFALWNILPTKPVNPYIRYRFRYWPA